jgi:hypothetical protein
MNTDSVREFGLRKTETLSDLFEFVASHYPCWIADPRRDDKRRTGAVSPFA